MVPHVRSLQPERGVVPRGTLPQPLPGWSLLGRVPRGVLLPQTSFHDDKTKIKLCVRGGNVKRRESEGVCVCGSLANSVDVCAVAGDSRLAVCVICAKMTILSPSHITVIMTHFGVLEKRRPGAQRFHVAAIFPMMEYVCFHPTDTLRPQTKQKTTDARYHCANDKYFKQAFHGAGGKKEEITARLHNILCINKCLGRTKKTPAVVFLILSKRSHIKETLHIYSFFFLN